MNTFLLKYNRTDCADAEKTKFLKLMTIFSVTNQLFFISVEFPAVLLNTGNGEIEEEFHYYVQPSENPILSEFCKKLTGITQV